jgi:hypothetical protein
MTTHLYPLVGQRVRIVGDHPRAGIEGKAIDGIRDGAGTDYFIEHRPGAGYWVSARNLEVVPDAPKCGPACRGWCLLDGTPCDQEPPVDVEHEGYHDHLDAIEARLNTDATRLLARTLPGAIVRGEALSGTVVARPGVLIPKGPAS